jgi:tRNA C32,U32 (ribose-2'-O)-methylase TrmJ
LQVLNIESEIAALRAIESPLDRESAARQVAEQARELLEAVSVVRAEAIKEVYDVFGGTKTSRLFGINRVALYRIIEPVRSEQEKQARATKWAIAAEALLTIAMSGSSTRADAVADAHQAVEGG